uniref:Uncharacterized protein n=1 Tax=Lotharella oceanica TaxID=641309 RepID=A0A7S2X8A0_9EUKA
MSKTSPKWGWACCRSHHVRCAHCGVCQVHHPDGDHELQSYRELLFIAGEPSKQEAARKAKTSKRDEAPSHPTSLPAPVRVHQRDRRGMPLRAARNVLPSCMLDSEDIVTDPKVLAKLEELYKKRLLESRSRPKRKGAKAKKTTNQATAAGCRQDGGYDSKRTERRCPALLREDIEQLKVWARSVSSIPNLEDTFEGLKIEGTRCFRIYDAVCSRQFVSKAGFMIHAKSAAHRKAHEMMFGSGKYCDGSDTESVNENHDDGA